MKKEELDMLRMLKLTKISISHPEEYEVSLQGNVIGFIRLNYNCLRVDYMNYGGEVLFDDATKGDGEFDESEKDNYIDMSKKVLVRRIYKDYYGR